MQFLTYAAYRLQLESAFLADELSSAAAARADLRSSRLSTAMSDVAAVNGNPGGQSEDGKTERSSAQVSQSSANTSPLAPGYVHPVPSADLPVNPYCRQSYTQLFGFAMSQLSKVFKAVTLLVRQLVNLRLLKIVYFERACACIAVIADIPVHIDFDCLNLRSHLVQLFVAWRKLVRCTMFCLPCAFQLLSGKAML